MRRALFLFMLIAALGATSSCTNTIQGMGRDIENAGESLQNL
ncbi:MAG: entericidin A/B family lipoprotein [Micavibrio aeruginosavorus]|uniref:Entericidin A/B family lipoprotein n=1 Tax=Micavibrio aeruginosavorus TaxID=349221 RepID=A0A7T5R4M6_9BACT|nr:MAG: entericidin A/B family lipoprotein [Micavibrio aeruginosavorus]